MLKYHCFVKLTIFEMAIIYIDFERANDKIIEVGAICVHEQKLVSYYHEMINQHVCNQYFIGARQSHCIHPAVLSHYGSPEVEVKQHFFCWLQNFKFDTISIHGHGNDTSNEALIAWIPEIIHMKNLKFAQVFLPPWSERHNGIYHLATYHMKQNCQELSCCAHRHSLTFSLRKSNNAKYLKKFMYGFHCALFDCFELAFFECKLPLFEPDFYFVKHAYHNTSMFIKQ